MPAGRPTTYRAEYAEQAYKYCLLGATDAQLSDFFGVSEQTINLWKKRHSKFFESIKAGKAVADAEVADKLYQRAKGYSHPEEKVFNNQGEVVRAETVKHYPPDPTAAIFWLKNRQKKNWRDKHDLEHTGENGGPIGITVTFVDVPEYPEDVDDDAAG